MNQFLLIMTLLKMSTLKFKNVYNDEGARKADFIWYCEYHLNCNVLIDIYNHLAIFSFAVVRGMSNKGL